jgi:hypothetical protein
MKRQHLILILAIAVAPAMALADEHDHGHDHGEHHHFDIAPYLIDGELVGGGLSHGVDPDVYDPPISVYGYAFGEGGDPYNPADPGVNQQAGVGNLPVGAALSYDISSSLLYWDGTGEVAFGDPGQAEIVLLMGSQARTLTGDSGPQDGTFIQNVMSDGSVHKHFTTSLYAEAGAGNIPGIGDPTYLDPPTGMYAFQIELELVDGPETYTSDPLWLVFNNGLDEHAHEEAMAHVPEPASMLLLAGGGGLLLGRRRRR